MVRDAAMDSVTLKGNVSFRTDLVAAVLSLERDGFAFEARDDGTITITRPDIAQLLEHIDEARRILRYRADACDSVTDAPLDSLPVSIRNAQLRPLRCNCCGGPITGRRCDSRWCSLACRQRAYRQRISSFVKV